MLVGLDAGEELRTMTDSQVRGCFIVIGVCLLAAVVGETYGWACACVLVGAFFILVGIGSGKG